MKWLGALRNVSAWIILFFFSDDDVTGVQTPHNDAIIIFMIIAKYDVKRILMDNESSADVLFYGIFQKINLADQLKQVGTPLIDFSENFVTVEGEITFPVTAGTEPQ